MSEASPSRTAWPSMQNRRRSDQARRLRSVWIVATILNMVLSLLIFGYVLVLKQYRDDEAKRIQQESVLIKQHTDTAICDLLDQFPANSALLVRPRAKYHCGPGLPVTPK